MPNFRCANDHVWPATHTGEPRACPRCNLPGAAESELKSHISDISTHLNVPGARPGDVVEELLRRYQKAVRKYLASLLRGLGPDAVADAYQDLFAAVLGGTLAGWKPDEQPFREYLKKVVRDCARAYRGKRPIQLDPGTDVAAPGEQEWLCIWAAESILNKSVAELRRTNGALADALDAVLEDQDLPGAGQAEKRPAAGGVKRATFRKHVQRARQALRELVRKEVRHAHPGWTAAQVDEELRTLGLGRFTRGESGAEEPGGSS